MASNARDDTDRALPEQSAGALVTRDQPWSVFRDTPGMRWSAPAAGVAHWVERAENNACAFFCFFPLRRAGSAWSRVTDKQPTGWPRQTPSCQNRFSVNRWRGWRGGVVVGKRTDGRDVTETSLPLHLLSTPLHLSPPLSTFLSTWRTTQIDCLDKPFGRAAEAPLHLSTGDAMYPAWITRDPLRRQGPLRRQRPRGVARRADTFAGGCRGARPGR